MSDRRPAIETEGNKNRVKPILAPTDPGIRLAVGVSGSGKTFGVTSDVKRAARHYPVLVLDSMHEWHHGDAGVTSVEKGIAAAKKGAKLIIVRAPDIVDAVSQACEWAIAEPGLVGIAIPEAHMALPNSTRLDGALLTTVCAWRHKKVSLWCDTQRLPLINRTVTEQSRELRIYAVNGELDLARVKEIGGKALVEAVQRCAMKMRDGDAGWHVKLDISRLPPYRIQRDRYDAKGYPTGIVEYA